jgi:N-methylhydantoinase A
VSIHQAAQGIVDVAVNNIVGAVRHISTQRGFDPRDFVLVAYGGAGPVHAGLVARELNISRVLVPAYPGLLSAQGMLFTDYQTELSRTVARLLTEIEPDELTAMCDELAAQCSSLLGPDLALAGRFQIDRLAEMCYDGQKHEIPVPIPPGRLTSDDLLAIAANLDAAFERLYGFLPSGRVAKLVNVRVFVRGRSSESEHLSELNVRERNVAEAPAVSSRSMYFPEFGGESSACPVYDRTQLSVGTRVSGPCVIEEDYSTVVVNPGQQADVDVQGNVFIYAGPATALDDAQPVHATRMAR